MKERKRTIDSYLTQMYDGSPSGGPPLQVDSVWEYALDFEDYHTFGQRTGQSFDHFKVTKLLNGWNWVNPGTPVAGGVVSNYSYYEDKLEDCISSFSDPSYLAKLLGPPPSNSADFELIPFVAEFTEVIELFSKKAIRSLTYGGFTWSLSPLYSDLKALIKSLKRLRKSLHSRYSQQPERWYRSLSLDEPFPPWPDTYVFSNVLQESFTGKMSFNGARTVSLPPLEEISKLEKILDDLGVNPDLKTVWDLIPFSFVVDYFLPIGDILEALNPRGWIELEAVYTGYVTINGVRKVRKPVNFGHGEVGVEDFIQSIDVYSRRYVHHTEHPDNIRSRLPDFEWPSFRELFNVAYLATSGVRSKNRFLKRL